MRRLILLVATLGLYSAPVIAEPGDAPAESGICEACEGLLELALGHPRRDKDRERDEWRHPAETLAFFRVEPGMTVVDFIPGGGWYTRILAPYLGDAGHYIALNPDVSAAPEKLRNYFGGLAQSFPGKAAAWTGMPETRFAAYNTDALPPELAGTVDRALIIREMHNLKRNGMVDRELTALVRLLKPDGLLGIVQHRARADAPDSYVDGNKGYLREADVIAMVESYGFELVARSEINANPADAADWPDGVWTLPPALRTGKDAEKYAGIGESDRMTLLFRKWR